MRGHVPLFVLGLFPLLPTTPKSGSGRRNKVAHWSVPGTGTSGTGSRYTGVDSELGIKAGCSTQQMFVMSLCWRRRARCLPIVWAYIPTGL